ncbi:S1 family peptidase [Catellatospora paridis]|uniref:S1 family peptidase n=1 Tax=Catellatospora paridis TaxID=1617086 RepID=UPI0018AFDFF3
MHGWYVDVAANTVTVSAATPAAAGRFIRDERTVRCRVPELWICGAGQCVAAGTPAPSSSSCSVAASSAGFAAAWRARPVPSSLRRRSAGRRG